MVHLKEMHNIAILQMIDNEDKSPISRKLLREFKIATRKDLWMKYSHCMKSSHNLKLTCFWNLYKYTQ